MKRPYLFALFLSLYGCLSPLYTSRFNPDIDFSQYKTFYCSECLENIDPRRPRYDNKENRRLIRDVIQQQLESRGYTVLEEDPDLLVEFDFIIEDHIDTVAQRTTSYRYWRGFEADAYNYKIGTLIINMIDSNEKEVVWQGSSEGLLDLDPNKVRKKVPMVVKRILNNFPYTVKQ